MALYIDRVNGNDSNLGTGATAAWRTLARLEENVGETKLELTGATTWDVHLLSSFPDEELRLPVRWADYYNGVPDGFPKLVRVMAEPEEVLWQGTVEGYVDSDVDGCPKDIPSATRGGQIACLRASDTEGPVDWYRAGASEVSLLSHRIRVVGGPRDGATSWVGLKCTDENGEIVDDEVFVAPFQRCQLTSMTNIGDIVVLQSGDQIVVERMPFVRSADVELLSAGSVIVDGLSIGDGYPLAAVQCNQPRALGQIVFQRCRFEAGYLRGGRYDNCGFFPRGDQVPTEWHHKLNLEPYMVLGGIAVAGITEMGHQGQNYGFALYPTATIGSDFTCISALTSTSALALNMPALICQGGQYGKRRGLLCRSHQPAFVMLNGGFGDVYVETQLAAMTLSNGAHASPGFPLNVCQPRKLTYILELPNAWGPGSYAQIGGGIDGSNGRIVQYDDLPARFGHAGIVRADGELAGVRSHTAGVATGAPAVWDGRQYKPANCDLIAELEAIKARLVALES